MPRSPAAVGRERSRSVPVGDDREPVAARNPVHRQDPRRGEQLGIGLDAHGAGPLHRGVEDGVGRRRVARAALHRPPGLQHDDGLRPRRGAQRRQEAPGVADRLRVQQDAVGVRIEEQHVQQLAEADVHGAAQRDHRRESDAARRGEIEHGRAHRARLRHEREPARVRDGVAQRRVQSDVGADDAERMRTQQADAARGRDLQQLRLPAARLVRVGRRRRQDDCRLDSGARAVLEDLEGRRGGHCDQRELHRLADRGERSVRTPREHAAMIGIDGVERAVEGAAEQILEDDPADRAGLARCADERDGRRHQQRAERVGSTAWRGNRIASSQRKNACAVYRVTTACRNPVGARGAAPRRRPCAARRL